MSSIRTIPAGPSRGGAGLEGIDADVISSLSPPSSASAPWKGFLDIRLNNGSISRRLLTESHVVIGRIPGVQLLLDHHTVSRRHAEMFCDPFGRWWIRDLGSTNGTLVNDEPVTEKVLQPSDKIAIGDFTLTFYVEPRAESRHRRSGAVALEDDKPTAIRTLMDFDPPRLAAEHLHILMEFGRRLINVEDPAERLGALCSLMVQNDFHGSMAVALKVKAGTPTMLSRPYRPGVHHADEQPYISRRVLSKLQETHEPVLAGNLISHGGGNHSVELTMSRDVMALWVVACPIQIQHDEMDVLYVTLPPECGSVEWLSLISLAAQVFQQGEENWTSRKHAQAHAAIERELETARQIQHQLVPKKQDFPGLDISFAFEPCKWVGGDYVDVVPMKDGRILFAVADVCGKGLQAALITSSLHTMVHATADGGRSLPELMERVNRYFCEWIPSHSFVTMIAVAIDPKTGSTECVNAGHPPPIVAVPGGTFRFLQSGVNPALGIAVTDMESEEGVLEPGEVLAMYTDGLTELRNTSKDMLGLERLSEGFAQICEGAKAQGVHVIAAGLNQMLEAFRGDQLPEDDRAFLLARRT